MPYLFLIMPVLVDSSLGEHLLNGHPSQVGSVFRVESLQVGLVPELVHAVPRPGDQSRKQGGEVAQKAAGLDEGVAQALFDVRRHRAVVLAFVSHQSEQVSDGAVVATPLHHGAQVALALPVSAHHCTPDTFNPVNDH